MLKLNSIEFGLIGFGAGKGSAIFLVDLVKTDVKEEEITYDEFKNILCGKRTFTNANGEVVQYEDLSKYYNEFLLSKNYHMYFKGGSIEKKEQDASWKTFITELSKDSANSQKQYNALQLRAPYIVWIGNVTERVGLRDGVASFYEYFNNVIAYIDKDTADLPLREICNHNFHSIIAKVKEVDELNFLDGKMLQNNKLYIVDMNDKISTKIQDVCIKNNFRYCFGYDLDNTLYVV